MAGLGCARVLIRIKTQRYNQKQKDHIAVRSAVAFTAAQASACQISERTQAPSASISPLPSVLGWLRVPQVCMHAGTASPFAPAPRASTSVAKA
eukprot:304775-Pleurochrysis_carterae.AAC.1